MARPGRTGYSSSMPVVLTWNGTDLPAELRSAPEGRYILLRVDDAPDLTDAEDAGLEAALASVRAGGGVPIDEARRRVAARLGR